MYLHMLMLYDMLFHNREYPLQKWSFRIFGKKIGTTNFHAITNEF